MSQVGEIFLPYAHNLENTASLNKQRKKKKGREIRPKPRYQKNDELRQRDLERLEKEKEQHNNEKMKQMLREKKISTWSGSETK